MPIVRNRFVKIVALVSVLIHAYVLAGHYGGMMQRAAITPAAATSSTAEAAIFAQIAAATVMCRASATADKSTSANGQANQEPGGTNGKVGASCPMCSGIAVAHALPPPSALLLGRIAVLIKVAPTADVSIAHLTRDSLPPPRGPPAHV